MSKGQKIGVFLIFVIAAAVISFFIFRPKTGEESVQEGAEGVTEEGVEVSKNANIVVDGANTNQEDPVPVTATPTVELTGSFADGAHAAKGTARIEEKNGQKLLIFADDFKIEDGPDLHVYLAGSQNPQSSADLHAQGDVDLGVLKNVTGAQEYVIPADLDFDPASVVVYCVPFKVVFGFANLNK